MVKIRLSRKGKKKQAYYHVVAVDENKKRDGAVLETIGSYNPRKVKTEEKLIINTELYKSWIAKGAQPTETIAKILKAVAK